MTSTDETTIVVPCYNEASRLPAQAFIAFAAAWPRGRFLFVNDGSTDETERCLADLTQHMGPRSSVLPLERNAGKGEAVRQGLLRALDAGAARVAFWDADLATPLENVLVFERLLDENPSLDVVIGARVALLGRHIHRRRRRHYVGRGFATVASLMLGLGIYDTQCGAKMFRSRPELREILASPFQSRWIFDIEILARYLRRVPDGASRIHEHPLDAWQDVGGSKLKPRDFVRATVDLGRIAWDLRRE